MSLLSSSIAFLALQSLALVYAAPRKGKLRSHSEPAGARYEPGSPELSPPGSPAADLGVPCPHSDNDIRQLSRCPSPEPQYDHSAVAMSSESDLRSDGGSTGERLGPLPPVPWNPTERGAHLLNAGAAFTTSSASQSGTSHRPNYAHESLSSNIEGSRELDRDTRDSLLMPPPASIPRHRGNSRTASSRGRFYGGTTPPSCSTPGHAPQEQRSPTAALEQQQSAPTSEGSQGVGVDMMWPGQQWLPWTSVLPAGSALNFIPVPVMQLDPQHQHDGVFIAGGFGRGSGSEAAAEQSNRSNIESRESSDGSLADAVSVGGGSSLFMDIDTARRGGLSGHLTEGNFTTPKAFLRTAGSDGSGFSSRGKRNTPNGGASSSSAEIGSGEDAYMQAAEALASGAASVGLQQPAVGTQLVSRTDGPHFWRGQGVRLTAEAKNRHGASSNPVLHKDAVVEGCREDGGFWRVRFPDGTVLDDLRPHELELVPVSEILFHFLRQNKPW